MKTNRYALAEQGEAIRNRRPHACNPSVSSARVVFTVKNFSKVPGVCHIGLNITATNTMRVLRRNGVNAECWPVQNYKELNARLMAEAENVNHPPVTHVIVSAPSWIQPDDFAQLCHDFPQTEIVLHNHSGTAFLSIDKFGIRNIRQCIDLQHTTHNMRVTSNNHRVSKFLGDSFGVGIATLPNLYDTETYVNPINPRPIGDTLRIGSFGAARPWKNQLTAAEAAVMLARRLGMNLELYVNSKRPDGGERMIESRQELFNDLPGCKLIEVPWAQWPKFRDIASTMHILFQPSFDETFNVVTADGIAEGVPSVTAPSIEWTPESWWCKTEDPASMVPIAISLLRDPHAVHEARSKLEQYVKNGIGDWLDFVLHHGPIL